MNGGLLGQMLPKVNVAHFNATVIPLNKTKSVSNGCGSETNLVHMLDVG
jgi:hypothetical protein